jgi:hypothetical protein
MENNNKLLADFLGHDKKGDDVTWTSPDYLNGNVWVDEHFFDGTEEYNGRRRTNVSELKFHKDWNWLMLVVNKISENDFVDDFEIKKCSVFGNIVKITPSKKDTFDTFYFDSSKENLIETVHAICVNFVQWYNTKK